MHQGKRIEAIREIQRQVVLADVANALGCTSYQRRGNQWILCPFHHESDPSLCFYDTTDVDRAGHFHCYGCGAHGDVFDLVKQLKNCEFPEALEWLAKHTRVTLPPFKELSDPDPFKRLVRQGLSIGYNKILEVAKSNKARLKKWAAARKINCQTLDAAHVAYLPAGPFLSNREASPVEIWGREGLEALSTISLLRRWKPQHYQPDQQPTLDLGEFYHDALEKPAIIFPTPRVLHAARIGIMASG